MSLTSVQSKDTQLHMYFQFVSIHRVVLEAIKELYLLLPNLTSG